MKKNKKKILTIFLIIIGIFLIYFFGFRTFSIVSPYCKTLPNNAVNIVSLDSDINDCPHWYFEIKSVLKDCTCLSAGRICVTDPDYNARILGCPGAFPACYSCPDYQFTPITNYGGLIEGYECTKDLIKTCSNGDIIEKSCINGKYVNTNNLCENCPTGQIKCSDGVCKDNCNSSSGIIILVVIVIICLGLGYIYWRTKK